MSVLLINQIHYWLESCWKLDTSMHIKWLSIHCTLYTSTTMKLATYSYFDKVSCLSINLVVVQTQNVVLARNEAQVFLPPKLVLCGEICGLDNLWSSRLQSCSWTACSTVHCKWAAQLYLYAVLSYCLLFTNNCGILNEMTAVIN